MDSPMGRIGQPLRVQFKGLIADVTLLSVEPSPIPPGFGCPPRPPRNTDAPHALQAALTNAPPGSTVSGGGWWDCYGDLVSNVVLVDKITGEHLAQ